MQTDAAAEMFLELLCRRWKYWTLIITTISFVLHQNKLINVDKLINFWACSIELPPFPSNVGADRDLCYISRTKGLSRGIC